MTTQAAISALKPIATRLVVKFNEQGLTATDFSRMVRVLNTLAKLTGMPFEEVKACVAA